MAKSIPQLDPLAVNITDDTLFEISQSGSYKATAAQLLNYISYLGTDTQRITYDGTSLLTISINEIENLYHADFEMNGTPPWKEGRVYWDVDEHCFTVYNDVSDTSLQVGQESITRVRNQSGSQITNGSIVYISGSSGQTALLTLAIANDHDKVHNLGVATHNIDDNSFGYVTIRGLVRGINTNSFNVGDSLYVSPVNAGTLTNIEPVAPYFKAFVGTVIVKGNNGTVLVNPSDHGSIDDLADISTIGETAGSIFYYDGIEEYWKPTSLVEIDSTASTAIINGDLTVSGHSAFGATASVDYPGFPTYEAILKLSETFGSGITGAGYGIVIDLANAASNAFTTTAGLNINSQVASAAHLTIQGANLVGNSTGASAAITNVIGATLVAAGAGDNATITNLIASEIVTNLSFGAVGVNLTNVYGSKVKILNLGSGEFNITNAYGINILTPGFNPTGVTTNLYGLYVEDQSTVGFVNHYNIYSAGANSKNYFEGDIYLGELQLTADSTNLTVVGDIYCNDIFTAASSVYLGSTKLSVAANALYVNGAEMATKQYVDDNAAGNPLNVGTNDSEQGVVNIYGANDGSAGGQLNLYHAGAPGNGQEEYWRWEVGSLTQLKLFYGTANSDPRFLIDGYQDGAHGSFVIDMDTTIKRGRLFLGEDDSVRGAITCYGNANDTGGALNLGVGAAFDDTITSYTMRVEEDDLEIRNNLGTILLYDGGTTAWKLYKDMVPSGTVDLGKTANRFANVWASLVNGADIGLLNKWRILESEKYEGYPVGIAIGNEGFKEGVVTEKMSADVKPTFVVTEDFIEYKGVKLTKEDLEKLLELL